MILPFAAAMWAVLRGGRALDQGTRRAVAWWAAAGVLAGVAVLFKYTAAHGRLTDPLRARVRRNSPWADAPGSACQ